MKTVGIVLLSILGLIILYIVFLIVMALCVNGEKEYQKQSRFYRSILNFTTGIGLKICRVHLTIEGKERLPEGRFLFICNHRSKFDPIVTWYGLKEFDIAFISKASNFKVPVFGRLIRKCCFMAIDRENPRRAMETLEKAAELMKNDEVSVGIYPEGTRNMGEGLLPFHNGIFAAAQNAGVPVVVATVKGTDLIKSNFPLHRTNVELKIIEVIGAKETCELRRIELSSRARMDMVNNLGIAE